MNRLLSFLIVALCPLFTQAQEVVFQDGGNYRIENVRMECGGFAPGFMGGNSAELYYFAGILSDADVMWTIKKVGTDKEGAPMYTLRHTATGLYATFDNERNDNKRYVAMTDAPVDDASFWTFTDQGKSSWSIDNVLRPEHHLHVRSTNLVGTYADDVPLVTSSVFYLFNSAGQQVTDFTPPAPRIDNQIGTLLVNNKQAVYDATTSSYLAVVTESQLAADMLAADINYDGSNDELFIEGHPVESGSSYEFAHFAGGRAIPIAYHLNDGSKFESTLYFTELPIVELYGTFSANASGGKMRISDPDNADPDPLYRMKAHWRGNTSLRRAKKNYTVKLLGEDGNKMDAKLLGFRSDNSWILDAAFVDPSRVRNRVSTDLWNDFHCAPYYGDKEPKARTGTRGRMVEVFLNGTYEGIYCFTEKLDRKQLKIKKIETTTADGFQLGTPVQHGLLYKAVEWDTTTYFGYDGMGWTDVLPWEPLDYNGAWGGWEIKYPDLSDGEPIDWSPLWDHTEFMYKCSDDEFRAQAAERFDLPVLRDYYLLQELAVALDNSAKNIYWYVYDVAESTKMTLSPWDFDGTWGRIWDGSFGNSYPESTLRGYYEPNYSRNKIFSYLMRLNVDGWNDQLSKRYAELRSAGYFAPDQLYQRFVDYFDTMRRSGAMQREFDRWSGNSGYTLDWDSELPFLRKWIDTHVATLDAFYQYDPTLTGLNDARSAMQFSGPVHVYAPDGRCVLSLTPEDGRALESALRTLPRGVYIVGGKKIKL